MVSPMLYAVIQSFKIVNLFVFLDSSVCKYVQIQNLCEADWVALRAPEVT
jgi:hypothetical protein